MTDDFAEWRGSIESRVSTLEATVATQAEVRARMDEDFSNLNLQYGVQKQLLEALRETQSEHTATLRNHTELLQNHTERLERLEAGQARLEAGQAQLEAGQATVLAGVQTIIGLLDRDIDGDADESDETPGIPS